MPHIGLEYKEKGIDFITDNTVSDKDARAAFELRIQNKSLRYDEKTGLLAKRWDGYFEGSKIRIRQTRPKKEPESKPPSEFMTTEEVADLISVSTKTIRDGWRSAMFSPSFQSPVAATASVFSGPRSWVGSQKGTREPKIKGHKSP
jgi:hypothetical protein